MSNHAVDEFNEAAAFVSGAFRILRNLAGNAIKDKEVLKFRLALIRQLIVDLDHTDDIDYIKRVVKAIGEIIDSPPVIK